MFGYPDSLIRARTSGAYNLGIKDLGDRQDQIIDLGSCHGHGVEVIRRNLKPKIIISADRWIDFLMNQKEVLGTETISYTGLNLKSNLPFGNESTGAVFLIHVIEHLDRPGMCLEEIQRILVKGGVCILATPNKDNIVHVNYEDKWQYTREDIRVLGERCGFRMEVWYLNANERAYRAHRIKKILARIPGTEQLRKIVPWKMWDRLMTSRELTSDDFSAGFEEQRNSLDIVAIFTKE